MKEYIIHEVFGEYIIDWSVASGSGLFNIHTLQWDKRALELAEIEPSQLSTVASPLTRLPPMRPQYAAVLDLADPIPTFILGGADGMLSNIGVGAVGPHEADNTIGTGGAIRVLIPEPRLDKDMRTACLVAAPERWAVVGVTAGGLIYDWFIQKFLAGERQVAEEQGISLYQLLDRYAQSVPPGSEGLILLPFLVGTRTPSWNPDARGVLFGLSYHHTKKHLARALMEGVIYNRFDAFKAVEEVVGGINSIRVSGGFVRSPVWTQIMADIYGKELLIPSFIETSSFGAAFMAMLALGLAKRLEDVRSMVAIQEVIRPDPNAHRIYQELFNEYKRLYYKLEEEFTAILVSKESE
jgi:gluconokinase